jgi:flavodoxin
MCQKATDQRTVFAPGFALRAYLSKEKKMKTAVVIYNSKTGTTKKYAEEIASYLKSKEISVSLSSIQAYQEDLLENADYVFLGCWTNGLMIMLQHPDKEWVKFAAKLPSMPNVKVSLFTTYKLLTGSMFRNMYKQLKGKFAAPSLELKSRNGFLSAADKEKLDSIAK